MVGLLQKPATQSPSFHPRPLQSTLHVADGAILLQKIVIISQIASVFFQTCVRVSPPSSRSHLLLSCSVLLLQSNTLFFLPGGFLSSSSWGLSSNVTSVKPSLTSLLTPFGAHDGTNIFVSFTSAQKTVHYPQSSLDFTYSSAGGDSAPWGRTLVLFSASLRALGQRLAPGRHLFVE